MAAPPRLTARAFCHIAMDEFAIMTGMNGFTIIFRDRVARLRQALRADLWYPHLPLALLTLDAGALMLRVDLHENWHAFFQTIRTGTFLIAPRLLPMLLIGGGLILFSTGLALRSRVAWAMSVILLLTAIVTAILGHAQSQYGLLALFSLCLSGVLIFWDRFDHSSVAAGTLFTASTVVMALFYATFGSFYLGAQFRPPIGDLDTALYFGVVSMTTVGYGDIVPATPEARWFSLSIIMVGVAVFVTSLTAVVTPLVSSSINRLLTPKDKKMERAGHYVIVGNTALAINTAREMIKRKCRVTRIVREDVNNIAARGVDTIVGDGGSLDILRDTCAERAECVLAMTSDDSENAFIVLAVRELSKATDRHVRTVIVVNDVHNMDRARLVQPDTVIAPQVFGGELVAMMLMGEPISPEFLMDRIFHKVESPVAAIRM